MFKVTRAIIVFEHSCFEFHFPPAIQFSRLRMERYFKSVEKKSADTHRRISHVAREEKKKKAVQIFRELTAVCCPSG